MTDEVNKESPPVVIEPVSVLIPDTPAVAAVPAVKTELAADTGAVVYEPTGDVGLDMALDFVGKAGIAQDHPAMVAAQTGDFSILKAALAAKGVQGWEQFVALGEAAYARTSEQESKKAAASREAVFKAAGGEESWKAVQAWAGANATAEEKAEINALLNQGGLAARGAVQYLLDAYAKASNVVVNPRDPVGDASRVTNASANGPLSPKEYASAVNQLNNKLGGRLEGSKEYADLQRRRGMFQG